MVCLVVRDDVLAKESCETLIKILDDNSDKHERHGPTKETFITQFIFDSKFR